VLDGVEMEYDFETVPAEAVSQFVVLITECKVLVKHAVRDEELTLTGVRPPQKPVQSSV
jgi:hypothetical protein